MLVLQRNVGVIDIGCFHSSLLPFALFVGLNTVAVSFDFVQNPEAGTLYQHST